jgi:diguanylate cyclase (GGDEF)-like protein/PAS domain S-box-containing protein
MLFSARIGATVVAVVGVLVLVGWYAGISQLTELIPGFGAMRPSTALGLLLLAVAILVLSRPIVAGIMGGLVVALGAVTLVEYALGSSLGADTILPALDLAGIDLGQDSIPIAPGVAAALIFLGAAIIGLGLAGRTTVALMLALLGLGVSQVALIGYAYDSSALYTFFGDKEMAPYTGICFLILAVAILVHRPDQGLIGLLRNHGTAGALLRGALPFFLLVPFLVGWLRLWGERQGLYGTAFGTAILVISMTVLGCGVTWVAALKLRELDHLRDASERGRAEVNRTLEATVAERTREVAASVETLHALIRLAPVGIAQLDSRGGLLTANDTWLALSGLSAEAARDAGWVAALHPDDVERVRRDWDIAIAAGRIYDGMMRYCRPDGTESWVQVRTTPIHGGRQGTRPDGLDGPLVVTGHLASVTDITALRQIEARIEHLAFHDALTGLPNRVLLLDRLGQALLNATRHGRGVGVLFLDLDRFKLINDSLGHHVGDAVLTEVAARLLRGARSSDTVARIGGDEFVVVCPEVAGLDDLARVTAKIRELITQPIVLRQTAESGTAPARTVSVGVSIGTACGFGSDDSEVLLREADRAMYRVKDPVRTSLLVAPVAPATVLPASPLDWSAR